MMVCLIFHTAIIINRKNWRIIIKLQLGNLSVFFFKVEFPRGITQICEALFCPEKNLETPRFFSKKYSLNNSRAFLKNFGFSLETQCE